MQSYWYRVTAGFLKIFTTTTCLHTPSDWNDREYSSPSLPRWTRWSASCLPYPVRNAQPRVRCAFRLSRTFPTRFSKQKLKPYGLIDPWTHLRRISDRCGCSRSCIHSTHSQRNVPSIVPRFWSVESSRNSLALFCTLKTSVWAMAISIIDTRTNRALPVFLSFRKGHPCSTLDKCNILNALS